MRIAIHAPQLLAARPTGVAVYTRRLLEALSCLDHVNEYELVHWAFSPPRAGFGLDLDPGSRFRTRHIKLPEILAYKYTEWGLPLPFDPFLWFPDVFLFTNFTSFFLWRSKGIPVVYDLSFELFPEFGEPLNVAYLRKSVPRAVRRATHVVTISESAKRDIISAYGVPADRITVLYPALGSAGPCGRKGRPTRPPDGSGHVLFVGTLEPRKNIERLITAYRRLPEATKRQHALVLVGGIGWRAEGILAAIDDALMAGENLVVPGYVTDDEMRTLFEGAAAFVYPSLYEGFGMPILEAMAWGVPVITANNSSLPEAGGDAATYVDVADVEGLTAEMVQVLGDPSLRQSMATAGLEHVTHFSWQRSAAMLRDVLLAVGA